MCDSTKVLSSDGLACLDLNLALRIPNCGAMRQVNSSYYEC